MRRALPRRWTSCRTVPSRAYRGLVYDTPTFRDFFRAMTPIAEIATLKIGSRPSSRTKSSAIEDLRAIPWVFSWAQSRAMLPGWYGTGEAFAGFEDKGATHRHGGRAGRSLQRLLGNMEMVLAKSDMGIAARVMPSWRRASTGMTRSSAASATGGTARMTACSTSPARRRLLEKDPGARSVDPVAAALYRAAQPAADRADETPPRGRDRSADCRGYPADDQRDRDGAAEQRVVWEPGESRVPESQTFVITTSPLAFAPSGGEIDREVGAVLVLAREHVAAARHLDALFARIRPPSSRPPSPARRAR